MGRQYSDEETEETVMFDMRSELTPQLLTPRTSGVTPRTSAPKVKKYYIAETWVDEDLKSS